MSTVRQSAAWAYRVLITLFAATVILEIFLAGLGVFRAMPGEGKQVSHKGFDDKFGVHAAVGGFLTGCSLLLLIVILIAGTGLRSIGTTFGLAVLTVVEGAPRDHRRSGLGPRCVPHRAGMARGPADPSRAASAHCVSTGAGFVDAGRDADAVRACQVRRLRP
jgi:hypothetical protein